MLETISRVSGGVVLPGGDYWGLSVWERDVRIRAHIYGLCDDVDSADLLLFGGSLVWRMVEFLRDVGVSFSGLWDGGYYVYGFFEKGLYGDDWLKRVGGQVGVLGGVDAVLGGLRRLGADSGLLLEIESQLPALLYEDDNKFVLSGAFRGFKKVDDITEDAWYAEMLELMEDAKVEGSRGLGVRKDILNTIGKRRGFIREDGDGGLAAALSSVAMRGMEIIARLQGGGGFIDADDADFDVVDDDVGLLEGRS